MNITLMEREKVKYLVPQKDIQIRKKLSIPLIIIATISINAMFPFLVFADLVTWLYQHTYFTIMGIPIVPREKYIQMNRHKLGNLSVIQKWSCWYCEYANGVTTLMKAVSNQTEIYSCAIKYSHTYEGQTYQKDFYEQQEFKSNQTKLLN